MNARLSMQLIADRIVTHGGFSDVLIKTCYDRQFLDEFSKVFPAIWVMGQRMNRVDAGGGAGFSGRFRQRNRVETAITFLAPRHVTGEVNVEDSIKFYNDGISNALTGWKPADADEPLTWETASDGPASNMFFTGYLLFSTTTTFQR